MTVLRVAGALVSIAYAIATASFFGAERAIEVFFAASAMYVAAMKLAQLSQLTEVMLPVYHRTKASGGDSAGYEAFSVLFNWMCLVAIAIGVLLFLLATPLMRLRVGGFSESDIDLGAQMFQAIIPLLFFTLATSMLKGLANAERLFGWPEAVDVVSTTIRLVALVLLVPFFGIWSMVMSLWIGSVCAFAGNAAAVHWVGYRHRLSFHMEGFRVLSIFQDLGFTFSHVLSGILYGFVFDNSLSRLPQGTFALFRYVQSYYSEINGILLMPISTVFFTHFSDAVAKGAKNIRELLVRALRINLAVSTLAIASISVAAYPLLGGMLGRQQFTAEQLRTASYLLTAMSSVLLVAGIGQVERKLVIAVGHLRLQYIMSSLMLLLSAAATYLLIQYFGVPGAMLSLWLNSCLLAAAPILVLLTNHREFIAGYPCQLVGQWLIAGGCGWAVGIGVTSVLPETALTVSRVALIAWGGALASISVAVTLFVARIVRITEVEHASQLLTRCLFGSASMLPMKSSTEVGPADKS
jgi:peptidoglycan biosynthesis protein MviN/MurJ (putative lipid II flippase)